MNAELLTNLFIHISWFICGIICGRMIFGESKK